MQRRVMYLVLMVIVALSLTVWAQAAPKKPPKNVTGLTATAITWDQIVLTWVDNANNEEGFYIMRRVGQVGDFVEIDDIGPNSQSYVDPTCDPVTEYCYMVQPYNQWGVTWSPVVCATTPSDQVPPEAPTGLSVIVVSPTQLDLIWTDNASNEDGFKIEVDEGDTGTFVYLDTVGVDVESYPATGLSVSVAYCFRVYAYNVYGDSGYSNEDCGTPSGQPPACLLYTSPSPRDRS